jgi:single-strand DNA-binding protein
MNGIDSWHNATKGKKMSYNKVIFVGNCTKDGELRFSQNGSEIYKNSIATSHKFTVNGEKREETMFIDFTAFARLGAVCNQYLRKGSKILVEGRLSFEQWVDQTNGQKRSKHSVIVETMQMLDSRDSGDHDHSQNTGTKAPVVHERKLPENNIPEIDINEEVIPF